MKTKTFRMWIAALALLAAVGCKPSVEGETRAWDQNKLTLQEWAGRFANFKPAIDGRVAEAQKDFEAAKGLSDPDARAAKMREANDKLYVLTTAFQEIDRKLKEYDNLKADPNLLKLPGTILMPAMQASEQILRSARMRMDGPVSNPGEALGRLRDASEGITRAMAPLQDARNRAAAATPPTGQQPPPGAPPMAGPGGPNAGNPAMGNAPMPQVPLNAPRPGAIPSMMGGMAQPGAGAGGPGMPPAGMNPAMANPAAGPRPQVAPPPGAPPAGAPPAGAPPAMAKPPGAAPAGGKPF